MTLKSHFQESMNSSTVLSIPDVNGVTALPAVNKILPRKDKILRQIQSIRPYSSSTVSSCPTPANTIVTLDSLMDDDISLMSSEDDDEDMVLCAPVQNGKLDQGKKTSKPFFLMPKHSKIHTFH